MSEHEKELNEAIELIESKMAEAVKEYESQIEEYGSTTKAARDEVKKLAEDHKSMIEQSEELQSRIKELEQLGAEGFKGTPGEKAKTWGASMVDSESFKSFAEGNAKMARVEVKNTIIGETGSPGEPDDTLVEADRMPGIVPGAFRSLNILDFVPMGTTGSNQIEYTREASWTNDAAETNEGNTKPESDLTFELVNDPVRTIAHFIKASKQILDDAPMLRSYIDRRMMHGLRNRLQTQILKGNGSAPNIVGLDQTGRHTDFDPDTGDNALDSLNKAKYQVVAADYQANVIWMNPADFGEIERIKETDSSNAYAAGGGAALSYINGGMTPMIWGLPVVASNDVASGKFYMLDTNAIQLFMRQGATIDMFEQDEDNVKRNLLTIRAELRAALAAFVPAAILYGDLAAE